MLIHRRYPDSLFTPHCPANRHCVWNRHCHPEHSGPHTASHVHAQ